MRIESFADIDTVIGELTVSLDIKSSYSLERIAKLLAKLDNPQEKIQVIHVAGTSGKTSTAYYIASMLKEAGYSVGLSVSPHIEQVNERVQIGLTPLPEKQFCSELTIFLSRLEQINIKPTYFELFIAFGFWYFAREQVDYAVIEVGVGGSLDATNVVDRKDKICVITDIGLDHINLLGKDLASIAKDKAGIIQTGNYIFMQNQAAEIVKIIKTSAEKKSANLHLIKNIDKQKARNLPQFQQRNWSLAKAVAGYILSENKKTFSETDWLATTKIVIPGRLEIIDYKGKKIILDGAHNGQKMRALTDSLAKNFSGKTFAVLLAISDNKKDHLVEIVELIGAIVDHIILTSFVSAQDMPRLSIDTKEVIKFLDGPSVEVELDYKIAFNKLLDRQEDVLLVTGSLYLVSAIRRLLK